MRTLNIFMLAIACTVASALCNGCGGASGPVAGVFVPKHSEPVLFVANGEQLSFVEPSSGMRVPQTVYAFAYTYTGTDDSSSITRVELNMGDGSGWVDITERNFNVEKKSRRPENALVHTYAAPGEYTVLSRTRWSDGTVLSSAESIFGPLQIVVEE